jgi:hypothetical protein
MLALSLLVHPHATAFRRRDRANILSRCDVILIIDHVILIYLAGSTKNWMCRVGDCPARGLSGWTLGVHAQLRLLHLLFVGLHCSHPSVHPSAPAASHRPACCCRWALAEFAPEFL